VVGCCSGPASSLSHRPLRPRLVLLFPLAVLPLPSTHMPNHLPLVLPASPSAIACAGTKAARTQRMTALPLVVSGEIVSSAYGIAALPVAKAQTSALGWTRTPSNTGNCQGPRRVAYLYRSVNHPPRIPAALSLRLVSEFGHSPAAYPLRTAMVTASRK